MIGFVAALPRNAEVADQFDLLADLLELEGAESFRVLAYRRAATRLPSSSRIGSIARQGRHQGAQKSTSTGPPRTVWSNVAGSSSTTRGE